MLKKAITHLKSSYDYDDYQDVDFSPLDMLALEQEQDFSQWSQEIRLTSPIGDKFDFITGHLGGRI